MQKVIRGFAGLVVSLAAVTGFAQGTRLPPSGPSGQPGKTVVFIASDYRNGGVMGAYRGFEEAARKLRWELRLADGQGRRAMQGNLLRQAINQAPGAIVFGGFDPAEYTGELAAARQKGILLVGWHAAAEPGPTRELFVNVSTRPADVAQMAVDFVIRDARARKRPVGVVIFNDAQFAVANAKTEAMKKGIAACRGHAGCRLLSVENIAISAAGRALAESVPQLAAKFGADWTYSLAINDAYFDEINFPLMASGRTDVVNVSAGDGSSKALGRIGAGVSQQVATVAEPLRLQGYQLADELNRAFAGVSPSGFQSMPILITAEVLKAAGPRGVDAIPEVAAAYQAIWGMP